MQIDVKRFARNVQFVVSDIDPQYPPRTFEELLERCNEIKAWIPQPKERVSGNNMIFTALTFTLFKDLNFIQREIVENLNDANWCKRTFEPKINPLGGVLRREDLTQWDRTNLRYYCPCKELTNSADIDIANERQWNGASKLAVICRGVTYYISNDWFDDSKPRSTKPAFYNWFVRRIVNEYSTLVNGKATELFYNFSNLKAVH